MEILEGLVKEGSFNWTGNNENSFDKEFEEMGRSPSGKRKSIPELSSVANVIICRCSRYFLSSSPPKFEFFYSLLNSSDNI